MIRVALIGDYNPSVKAHRAIPLALALAGPDVAYDWLHSSGAPSLAGYGGVWCVPASPYANEANALAAIRFARETGKPFLGTCGGFQHALIEYALNVCGIGNADHAETNPDAAAPVVAALACSLVEKERDLEVAEGSQLHRSYGALRIREGYRCNYGPNPAYEARLFGGDLRVTARDENGEVRAAELTGHPFFVGTLFQPERRALTGELPPLVRDFAAAIRASLRG